MESKHILIVDDDDRIRSLLRQFLVKNGYFTSTARTVAEAKSLMDKYIFDLLTLDVMMPGETGMEFLAWLRRDKKSTVPAIMLTAMGEVENRISGLEIGADDYLPKPFEPKELLLRIKNILGRYPTEIEGSQLFSFGDFTLDQTKLQLKKNGEVVHLTDMESGLLLFFSKNVGNILSREEICSKLKEMNERSIDVQITRLRRKIEDNPKKPIFLQTVRNKGYVFYK